MSEEKFPPVGGSDPDTSTDDEIGNLDAGAPPAAIPVAEPSAPPPAPGPRVFPQHYSILIGSVFVLVGAFTVWEREHVFGKEIRGPDMISGAFLLSLALYSVIVSVLNIVGGRLRGMAAAFVTGVAALYLGIGKWLETRAAEGFQGWSDLKEKADAGSFQDRVAEFVGQIGPGVWMSLIGGVLIILVFVKAIFGGGGKKDAAPAPATRRRGRR